MPATMMKTQVATMVVVNIPPVVPMNQPAISTHTQVVMMEVVWLQVALNPPHVTITIWLNAMTEVANSSMVAPIT
jgi:hypothetical protein